MDLMGFVPSDASLPVRSFSGGWKMRIGLGKVLLQEPGVLMLDEPTNHLDLDSVEWLEAFLRNQQLPMIIVSHDREVSGREGQAGAGAGCIGQGSARHERRQVVS